MRKPSHAYTTFLAAIMMAVLSSHPAVAQVVQLPVPSECASSETVNVSRSDYPEQVTAYSQVDLYCGEGSSAKRVAKGLTLCNSDYDRNEVTKKTVSIAVAHAGEAGNVTVCAVPESLRLAPHPGKR